MLNFKYFVLPAYFLLVTFLYVVINIPVCDGHHQNWRTTMETHKLCRKLCSENECQWMNWNHQTELVYSFPDGKSTTCIGAQVRCQCNFAAKIIGKVSNNHPTAVMMSAVVILASIVLLLFKCLMLVVIRFFRNHKAKYTATVEPEVSEETHCTECNYIRHQFHTLGSSRYSSDIYFLQVDEPPVYSEVVKYAVCNTPPPTYSESVKV